MKKGVIQKNRFDFEHVKEQIKNLTPKEQIKYLIEKKTDFLQVFGNVSNPFAVSFHTKCDIEIEKIKAFSELESVTPQPKEGFKLREAKGKKMDLIRVLNALYELRFFEKSDGQIPTKEEFMTLTGHFFGIDLSKYDTLLSQALNNTSLEANLKVFEDMKVIIQSKIII